MIYKIKKKLFDLWKSYVNQKQQEQLELIRREQQCALDWELAQLTDILNLVKSCIPPNINIVNDIDTKGFPIEKVDTLTYKIKLYKKDRDIAFSRAIFHSILQPTLNSAFDRIRSNTEYLFRQEQERLMQAVKRANNCKTYACQEALCHAQEEYQYFAEAHYHRLFGVSVVSYQDFPDCIVILVRCDAIRIVIQLDRAGATARENARVALLSNPDRRRSGTCCQYYQHVKQAMLSQHKYQAFCLLHPYVAFVAFSCYVGMKPCFIKHTNLKG